MLNFGNKEFRNLQEQVLKNAQDIETLKGRENLQVVIVNELPEVGNPNYIYLVAKDDGESPDVYDEYIWLEDEERYEKIGGVSIDLTNYVTLDSEQTISGVKKFTEAPTFTKGIHIDTGVGSKWSLVNGSDYYLRINENDVGKFLFTSSAFVPYVSVDLGETTKKWKDLYLGGEIKLSPNSVIKTDQYGGVGIYVGGTKGFMSYGDFVESKPFRPFVTNSYDLGNTTYFWRNLHLTGYITDGANTVSVANIASKATSTFISGTFDSNGESTIDTEQAGTPEGLFIFTYGNCQCFLRLTATMVQNADTTPIRIACPMIYNSGTVNGWLNITKSGYILILKITDGTNHVDSGYGWTLTKTNLI